METIGARVLRARKKLGLFQHQVASKARCTQSTIAKLETDRGSCEFFTAIEVARVLGVSLDWLAFGDEVK